MAIGEGVGDILYICVIFSITVLLSSCPSVIPASRLGLCTPGAQCLSGMQVDNMELSELCEIIPHVSVMYRVSPRHKHRIVKVRPLALVAELTPWHSIGQ